MYDMHPQTRLQYLEPFLLAKSCSIDGSVT